MLKNILGLRERRIADVMVPRADIVAVQEDIALGELVKGFETAGHSRLVDRKSTRLNSSHQIISYAVFCLKKKNKQQIQITQVIHGSHAPGAAHTTKQQRHRW